MPKAARMANLVARGVTSEWTTLASTHTYDQFAINSYYFLPKPGEFCAAEAHLLCEKKYHRDTARQEVVWDLSSNILPRSPRRAHQGRWRRYRPLRVRVAAAPLQCPMNYSRTRSVPPRFMGPNSQGGGGAPAAAAAACHGCSPATTRARLPKAWSIHVGDGSGYVCVCVYVYGGRMIKTKKWVKMEKNLKLSHAETRQLAGLPSPCSQTEYTQGRGWGKVEWHEDRVSTTTWSYPC